MITTTQVRIWAVIGLLSGSMLQAQPPTVTGQWKQASGETDKTEWRAQWIWMPASEDSDMLLARKTFSLSDIPEQALLSITASSRYQLFVNGNYLCSGPARCAPHHQSFDVLDVTRSLQKGRNVLAVRVHHQREGVSYYGASRAGLLAQLDFSSDSPDLAVQTDDSWRVSADKSWINSSPRMAVFHLEVCDRVDMRRGAKGWLGSDFKDKGWAKAAILNRETGWPKPQKNDRPGHLIPPWTSLNVRDIPYLVETRSETGQAPFAGSIPALKGDARFNPAEWNGAPVIRKIPVNTLTRLPSTESNKPITVPPNSPDENRVYIFDMEEVENGRPFLDIMGPSGSVVDIMSAPYLLNESLQSPIVASTYVDRIVLSGKRERWQAFYMKPVRWLAVVFRHLPEEATLFTAGLMRSEYPFEEKGYFRSPDYPQLQTLWDGAAKTLRVCTTDAYTDNYRERRQYAQTAYYACLGSYAVFGDHALQGRYLKQIAEEQLANGLMPAYAPRHGDDFMVILDSNCFWIRGLHQYLLYSGDKEATRTLLPAARQLLNFLHGSTNPEGLIDSPSHPYWLDHALIDRRGANFCLNAHYLGALEDFAQVLEWLNEPGADAYRSQAGRMRQALQGQFWNPEKQLFADALVDGERSSQFSEHSNAMAMALKIANPEQMEAIALQLCKSKDDDFVRRASGVMMVTPAMSYYLHAGLCEAGYADESWDLLWKRFEHMVTAETNGTLWEEWWLDGSGRNGIFKPITSGRSDAQTESAFPPALFSRYILGIEPMSPGLRDIVLRHYPSSRLHRREGAIPTPSGLLEVAWDISPKEFGITLQTPPHTSVRVDLASLGMPSRSQITINNQPVSAGRIKEGFLVLSSGNHSVRVMRKVKKSGSEE